MPEFRMKLDLNHLFYFYSNTGGGVYSARRFLVRFSILAPFCVMKRKTFALKTTPCKLHGYCAI